MDAFYSSMERYFVEHPFDPERLLAEHAGWNAHPERLAISTRPVRNPREDRGNVPVAR